MAHLVGRQLKSVAATDFARTTTYEKSLLDSNGCYSGTVLDVSRGKFQWGISNSPEDTYWQNFEWIQARLVLLDGEVRDKIPRNPPSGFGAQKKKSAQTAAQNGPFNRPPPQFFVGTQPSKSSLDDWSYDEPAVTEKTTHDTPEKKKRRTNRDNWASGKRVFKPHQEIKEKACTGKSCKYDCSTMTLAHKSMIRAQLKVVFEQPGAIGGLKGQREFLASLMRAGSVDEKTMAKKGWLPKAHMKVDGMRCMYCKELPPEQRGDDHTWGQRHCPNFAAGVALFAQRKALYYAQRTNIHASCV